MNVSLIITTYNRPDALSLVLDSCLKQSELPDEIIIGDDGSTYETKELIDRFKQRTNIPICHVWQEDKGFRLSRSRNLSCKKASSEYIIIIDGDMILHPKFISNHKTLATPNALLQGHRVLLNDQLTNSLLSGENIKLNFNTKGLSNKKNSLHIPLLTKLLLREDKSLRTFKGCNFSCWKQDILKVNGFNEDFVGWGKEDTEFAIRMMNTGVQKLDVRFGAVAYHLDHGENSKHTDDEQYHQNLIYLKTTLSQQIKQCKNGIKQL